jgi:integrase/recombinase XerD
LLWRDNILWGRVTINGREVRWSLQTDNTKLAAERRKAGKDRLVADKFGDADRSFVEALELWSAWIRNKVGSQTVKRYTCSLAQLMPWLDGKKLSEIDGRLTRLKRVEEKHFPIVLPEMEDIELVIWRSPPMVAAMIRIAMATGAREHELCEATRGQIDHRLRQMTLIGKGRRGAKRTRVIDLTPFDGYALVSGVPAHMKKPFMFWHSDGLPYEAFFVEFKKIVDRTVTWARRAGISFRKFRFHDLRHWHAVHWLKDGRSIYDLQRRLGHSSLKTTEAYCAFLTAEEERAVKGLAQFPAQTVPSTDQLPTKVQ